MKLRAILLGFLATLLLGGVASAELVLDWPHNEDNGIFCYHCHSEDPETGEDWWVTTVGLPTDPDFSVANWVCKRCHDPEATRTIDALDPDLAGPTKTLHSSATTGSTKDTWTTQCIDCHEPHFQTQKDWGGIGGELDPVLYVATGKFDTNANLDTNVLGALAFDANDQVLGGPLGTSSIGISGITIHDPSMDPPETKWINKGKPPIDITPFEDRDARVNGGGTRGLILVVNRLVPADSRTFEIVEVTPAAGGYILKVNGDLTKDHNVDMTKFVPGVANGGDFGVLYGASIRTNAITSTGFKTVKFFNPNHTPGTYGGTVDLSGTPEPVGLCQVCHDDANTAYYDSTTAETGDTDHHVADGTECVDCHDILTGAAPVLDHSSYISAVANCADCHFDYDNTPDTAHIGSGGYLACQTCHTSQAPWMNLNVDGARIGFVSDGTLQVVSALPCTQCHNASYGTNVDYTNSIEHPNAAQVGNKDTGHDNALTTQALCDSCHGPLADGVTIVADGAVPGGHNDTCNHCHITVTPSPVELTPTAQQARDVDGFLTPVECNICHTAEFSGHLHPQHATSVVINSTVSPNTVNCDGCHNAPAGNGPFVGTGEVHVTFGCATCHNTLTDGLLKGSANGADINGISADAAYECGECHAAHFDGHDHGTEYDVGTNWHDVRFVEFTDVTASGTDCFKCHDDKGLGKGTNALSTWDAIMVEHQTIDGAGGQNACEVCHNSSNVSGDADTPDPAVVDVVITTGSSVTCIDCHVAKNGPHGSHLSTEFAWTSSGNNTIATCGSAGCHNAGGNLNVVLDIHGKTADNDNVTSPSCSFCHIDAPNNDYTRKGSAQGTIDGDATLGTAGDRQRDCLVCHDPATYSKPFIHHEKNGTVAFTVTNCATKCHNSTGYVANHSTGTSAGGGMVVDAPADPDKMQLACTTCHDAIIGDMGDGNNIMLASGDDKVHDE
ncbi:MAG: hypothetical protein KAS94_06580, partial [Desulfobulbaceae bacterium]|nr:hypothetical protein [Desulfobulbaceae bacterium]